MQSLVGAVRDVLGENLLGLIVYGSLAEPEDYTPMSDVNVAVIVREKPPVEVRARLMERLGADVSPVFLTLDELRRLAEDGEFIAHEIIRGGRLAYGDQDVAEVLTATPPVNQRTVAYLSRHTLACIGLSLESLLGGRPHSALSYAYKSLRSACRFLGAKEGLVLLRDRDVLGYLRGRGLHREAEVFEKLRDARRRGVSSRELLPLLSEAVEAAAGLLGLKAPDPRAVVELARAQLRYVGDVRAVEDQGGVEIVVTGVDGAGSTRELRVKPG